ncbi:NO-inducible flavohemoprotein [Psychrobacillus vulpis]|uniref:Flavohemoprotein n=1 Tax=Psychrobacillus vulpis TaxID=2325572 RepID=A0A544TVQ6_9BACI|nr:NO-inducible flavohemoprotein [Psychrobacillus vulpis]TQR21516.1 NO-inducible flavohemoprotein [Psychrobacillus vulpis]
MLSQQTIDIVKSTAPVLEVHGVAITTVFYKNLFEAHPELLNIFNHANQSKGRQQTALANAVYSAAVHIDNLAAIIPAVKQIGQKHVSLGIKPEHYPIVGEHLLGAIKEVLGDAATDDIINAWAEAYGVIADAFIGIEEEMYVASESKQGGWRFFKDFIVVHKEKESENITSFYLKPADGNMLPTYEPGQFITIRVSVPGEKYLLNRQYSLSKASDVETFRISVKKEDEHDPAGKVSVHLHNNVNVGDTLELSAPAGEFSLDVEKTTPVTLISGGVGITPMMSMFETIAKNQPSRKVSFIYSARNENLHPFDKDIRSLMETMEDAEYVSLYSDEGDGFITKELLATHAIQSGDVYICGPVGFMEAMINHLLELGYTNEQIHYEFFGPALQLELVQA